MHLACDHQFYCFAYAILIFLQYSRSEYSTIGGLQLHRSNAPCSIHWSHLVMSEAKSKAAAVHAAPVYMNKQATIEKVVRLIKQAGQEGVKLLVLPETFVPGYPVSSQSSNARYA